MLLLLGRRRRAASGRAFVVGASRVVVGCSLSLLLGLVVWVFLGCVRGGVFWRGGVKGVKELGWVVYLGQQGWFVTDFGWYWHDSSG